MRITLLISLAVAIGVCSAVANATTTRSDCALRSKTIKGHKAVVYCGPATASLHIAGKTYTFKNGTCIWSGGLILTIGTQLNGIPASANNEGAPLIQLSSSIGTGTVYAYSGRFHLGTEPHQTHRARTLQRHLQRQRTDRRHTPLHRQLPLLSRGRAHGTLRMPTG